MHAPMIAQVANRMKKTVARGLLSKYALRIIMCGWSAKCVPNRNCNL